MEATPYMTTSNSNRSLLILFSVVVLDLIGFGIVVPILPFYAQQFGANATILGFLLMSFSLMQFAGSSFWGRLSDKFGRKTILLITMAGSCAGLIMVGAAPSLLVLFAGRILSGFFSANISVASAYVSDVTTEENRAKGMGLIGAAFGVGFLLGPALGGVLSKYSYATPMYAAAGLTALNLIYASLRLPEPKRHHATDPLLPKTKVLSHKPIFKLCFIYFIFSVGVTQLESVFAFFMMDRFQYDAMHVAYILALMALIMILIQGGLIRMLTQKYGETLLILSGALILAFAFFFVPRSTTVALLLFPLCIASVGRAVSQPALMSLVSKKSPPHMRGAVMGTFQASASLGRVIGPAVAGILYDHWQAGPFYFAAVLLVIVFFAAINL